ncbi:MAG TPA: TonB family protein [Gemmatimonadales bacterium]
MKVLKVRKVTLWLALAGALFGVGRLHAQAGFQVIVNDANAVRSMTAAEISDLFLRRTTQWRDGQAVIPVDLPDRSPVRDAFTVAIHDKSTAQVKAFWQRQVFSGRQVPPAEQGNDQAVLALVQANPHAIGYVADGLRLPSGVRRVDILGGSVASGSAHEIYTVATVDLLPELVSSPAVRYPSSLRRDRIEGDVVLKFVVDPSGRVDAESIEVIESTVGMFERPAIDAVRRSSYRPGRFQGRSVPVEVQQTVRFRLSTDQ